MLDPSEAALLRVIAEAGDDNIVARRCRPRSQQTPRGLILVRATAPD